MTSVDDSARTPARWRRLAPTAAGCLLLGGLLAWWFFFDTYHFVVVDEGALYRDGNRGMREFKTALRKARARTVICLVDDREIQGEEYIEEQALLRERGIRFVRIPIVKGAVPTSAHVSEFLAIATDPTSQPVLYHDNEGIRRAGMMMAAYQESVLGYSDEEAKAAVRGFGHSERTLREVEEFIDAYDGASRTVKRVAK